MDSYSTKDIAIEIGIAESTVRKYASLLENKGYIFNRNISGNRIFTKQDIDIFLEFKKQSSKGIQVDDIASTIATKYTTKPNTDKEDMSDNTESSQGITADILNNLEKKIDVLTDLNEKQAKFNQELLKRLDQQQKYIENRLNERDKLLTESLKESMETRKLIAAAKEEKKGGFFSRLFRKE